MGAQHLNMPPQVAHNALQLNSLCSPLVTMRLVQTGQLLCNSQLLFELLFLFSRQSLNFLELPLGLLHINEKGSISPRSPLSSVLKHNVLLQDAVQLSLPVLLRSFTEDLSENNPRVSTSVMRTRLDFWQIMRFVQPSLSS